MRIAEASVVNVLLFPASDLIRTFYIRFYRLPTNFTRVNLAMRSGGSVDEYFVRIKHPVFEDCYEMAWTKALLDAGIYYTQIIVW